MKYELHKKDLFKFSIIILNLLDGWSSRTWKSLDSSEENGGIIKNELMLKLRNQLVFDFNYQTFDEIQTRNPQ